MDAALSLIKSPIVSLSIKATSINSRILTCKKKVSFISAMFFFSFFKTGAVHVRYLCHPLIIMVVVEAHIDNLVPRNGPRCEKTGLWGFRPGPTQTRLYSHRRWLEA